MKTLVLFAFLLVITALNTLGQSIQGIVINEETKQPIPYVNVGVPEVNFGTVTNSEGVFVLDSLNDHLEDTFRISSVGYQTKNLQGLALIRSSEILLKPKMIELNEILISEDRLHEKTIGNKTRSTAVRAGFRRAELGHEIGSLFKVKNKPTIVKRFQANITENTNQRMKFRLNFYRVELGLPGSKLVQQNIIFNIKNEEGLLQLDLEPYEITLNEDFFCAVELIDSQNPEDVLFFSAGFLNKKLVWRETSHGSWEKMNLVGIGFSLVVDQ